MNKFFLLILLCNVLIIDSCNMKNRSHNTVNNNEQKTTELDSNFKEVTYYKKKGYQVFNKYGFAIKAPCQLKDVSRQTSGDFALNYGGVDNEDSPAKFAAYQLIVTQLPVGFKHMSESDQTVIKKKLLFQAQKMDNYQAVKIGHEGYDGFIMETTHNGYALKGESFIKDDLIFGLTVISNDRLESRFNQFTNSLKFFPITEATNNIKLLEAAEAKGFQRGVIQNCLETQWTDFGDRKYYSYIKTLKSGMKLYRAKIENMMLEIYVQNNIIKIQASTFILNNQTQQTIKEIDAWIISCNPLSVSGNLSTERTYKLKDFEVMLKNQRESIFYMISAYN